MANELEQLLTSLGLEHQESKVYLQALSIGTSPASIIAKRCKLPRSTARYTCEQLVGKQLMIESQKGNTKLFTPENPEKLKKLLEMQLEEIEGRGQRLNASMQDLKRIFNPYTVIPKVRFYEGIEGIKEMYNQILSLKSDIDSFEEKGEMYHFFPEFVKHFIARRLEYKIFNRVICPATSAHNVDDQKALRSVKFLAEKEFPFTGDIKICKDQVSIVSFDQNMPVAVTIQNQDIANNFRLLFGQMWKMLGGNSSK